MTTIEEQLKELKEEIARALEKDAYDWNWLLCVVVFLVVAGGVLGLRKTLQGWLEKQVKKTDNVVDDFIVQFIGKWYVPFPFSLLLQTSGPDR